MRRLRTTWIVTALLGLGVRASPALAQGTDAATTPPPTSRDVLRVVATDSVMRLDGRLDERIWLAADSITEFHQREPLEGARATERTVVKVTRDADALYVGVRAEDREPAGPRASQLRRDASLESDDNVTLLIDGLHDRRGAFLFRTNPNGAMWDAQLSGSENRNEDWNGIWWVATRRDSAGWTAEFRIPFRTLRYHAGRDGTFGFNVRRLIRRKNEEVLWTSWARKQGLQQLLTEGTLAGLGRLTRSPAIEVRPYVLGRLDAAEHDGLGSQVTDGAVAGKGGLDAKFGLTSTLTADLTLNTDFAQVEADRQVINLTRFPLFFPEKRAFFLESSELFAFGTEGRTQLFYSRRVGLSAGTPVPIWAGGRIYGKVGNWSLGLLDARTGTGDDANDVAIRVRRDLFARSTVGAMATLRSGPAVDGIERAAGVDASLPLIWGGQNLVPSMWIAGTETDAAPGLRTAWRAAADFPNDLFDSFISFYRIASGFNPTLGFVQRAGIWETNGHVDFLPRPNVLGIRQLDLKFPIPSWDIITDETGSLARVGDWQTARFEWRLLGGRFRSDDNFEINFQRVLDVPPDSFELVTGVDVAPGRYWWNRGEVNFETSSGRPVSVDAQLGWGRYYDGHSTELEASATVRGGGHLIVGTDLNTTHATLPGGEFTAVETAARVEYAFNPRATLLAFMQYNNEDRRADFNIRFHWIPAIGDDVYVVWNSGYSTDPASPYRFPRRSAFTRQLNGALVVKAVHRLAW